MSADTPGSPAPGPALEPDPDPGHLVFAKLFAMPAAVAPDTGRPYVKNFVKPETRAPLKVGPLARAKPASTALASTVLASTVAHHAPPRPPNPATAHLHPSAPRPHLSASRFLWSLLFLSATSSLSRALAGLPHRLKAGGQLARALATLPAPPHLPQQQLGQGWQPLQGPVHLGLGAGCQGQVNPPRTVTRAAPQALR